MTEFLAAGVLVVLDLYVEDIPAHGNGIPHKRPRGLVATPIDGETNKPD